MSTQAERSVRYYRDTVEYSTAGAGSVVVQLDQLGQEGRLVACMLRKVSGAATTVAIRIFEGEYTTSQDPALVPDEDIVYDLGAAAIATSTTVADINENLALGLGGAYYGRFDKKRYAAGYRDRSHEGLFLALTYDDTCTARVLLRADMVA